MTLTKKTGFILVFLFVTKLLFAQEYSELWGKSGEKWNKNRLPDFSYAGYHEGETPIPDVKTVVSVKDFGATGNGVVNDTEAFKKAIAEAKNGAVYIPNGTYRITEQLIINKSNIVLKGESRDKTILYFPWFLNDIMPNWGNTTEGRPTSNFSWNGGFVKIEGDCRSNEITKVVQLSKRGDKEILVESASELQIGQIISIEVNDTEDHSLFSFLYSGDPGPIDNIVHAVTITEIAKITSIKGNKIIIDRPLKFDLNRSWTPSIHSFNPSTKESGIENITFLFPNIPYEGHFTELGHNALKFHNVYNCWARNIKIRNCDSGIFFNGRFCTVDGVVFESERKDESNRNTPDITGHHGVYIVNDDNKLTNFVYKTKFIHDISVSHNSGNVIENGSGVDLALDHHCRHPFANLFTNINLGEGSRMYASGGGKNIGRHSGAWETFWNIKAIHPLKIWKKGWGPDMMNFIGVNSNDEQVLTSDGIWFEPIPNENIFPQNLYSAQLKLRLSSNK